MVMRCVLKHHVCLCVLSTAVLAGLALITAQTKVYAESLNCNGIANTYGTGVPGNPSGDNPNKRIECDGRGMKDLSGKRTIDMDKDLKPAVKVHGRTTNITIVGKLTVTDNGKRNTGPAIQVYNQGVLTLAGEVSITGVHKGIVAESKGSVIVTRGVIGVREGGGAVIEVKNGGDVMLIKEVKVNGGGNNTGIEVGGTGGTVTLGGASFTGVNKGIVFKGSGNVMGGAGGATINLADGGVGIKMEGTGRDNATVMNMTINGGRGSVGAEVTGEGTLVLNKVTMTNVQTGARVSNGKLTVMGGEIQASGVGGTGAEVSGGDLMLSGGVKIAGTTMGLRVAGGSATMMGGKITGRWGWGYGGECGGWDG
ncbi:hypothetical protein m07a_02110 [Bartonella schoenbuchensis m07a]|uniref:Right handed beta helix domain-containing protein n=2 Tax=Bartonella schoenbuchensis TaxID=165694 RepID=N6UFM2_9HYPH|nr:hypothetical protein m07a_02110 [Bartonella schoenbuchensis m07a]